MTVNVLDKFLRYVVIDTQSVEDSSTYPSTAKQWDLLQLLERELREIGLPEVRIDEYGYVFATIPSTTRKTDVPVIGFIAHVDTSPEMSGADVRPIVHRNYQGQDLVLPDDPEMVLRVSDNPWLAEQIGHDIVTASGATLLGADNKAGVAEIVAAAEYLMAHPEIPHGTIRIAFTPDEEVGAGTKFFDVAAIRRRLRLHDGRRDAGRARDREFFRRRDHDHVPRVQHASGLCEGEDGQRDQGRGRLHQPAARRRAVTGNDRGLSGLRASVRRARVG